MVQHRGLPGQAGEGRRRKENILGWRHYRGLRSSEGSDYHDPQRQSGETSNDHPRVPTKTGGWSQADQVIRRQPLVHRRPDTALAAILSLALGSAVGGEINEWRSRHPAFRKVDPHQANPPGIAMDGSAAAREPRSSGEDTQRLLQRHQGHHHHGRFTMGDWRSAQDQRQGHGVLFVSYSPRSSEEVQGPKWQLKIQYPVGRASAAGGIPSLVTKAGVRSPSQSTLGQHGCFVYYSWRKS